MEPRRPNQRFPGGGGVYTPFSVFDNECSNRTSLHSNSRADMCKHIADRHLVENSGPAGEKRGPSGVAGTGAVTIESGVLGDVSRNTGMNVVNPATGMFETTVVDLARREYEAWKGRSKEDQVGTTAVKRNDGGGSRGDFEIPVSSDGRYVNRETAYESYLKQRDLDERVIREKQQQGGVTSRGAAAPGSDPVGQTMGNASRGINTEMHNYSNIMHEPPKIINESMIIKPEFDSNAHPLWPYQNPSGVSDVNDDYRDKSNIFVKKNKYTYTTMNFSSRAAQYTYTFPEKLNNVVGYQLTSFACTNLTPVISNHNNKLIIVDNCFDPSGVMIERTVTVPDMYINPPAYGSTRSEADQVQVIANKVVEWTQGFITQLNTENGQSLYDDYGQPISAAYDVRFKNLKIPIDDMNQWPLYMLGYTNKEITVGGVNRPLTEIETLAFQQLYNWRFVINLWGPNLTSQKFFIKDSSLLGQLGIKAFSNPVTETRDEDTEFPNLHGTIKTMSIFLNNNTQSIKTVHYKSTAESIMYEQALKNDPQDIMDFDRRDYHSKSLDKLHVKLTVGDFESDLFNFYNHTHYFSIAVMHEK